MDLSLDLTVAASYSSSAQRSRVLSESWVAHQLYCPNCSRDRLRAFPNNKEAADFECSKCKEQFEVKSGRRFGRKIVNGAYDALMRRLTAADNPNLILLRFDQGRTAIRTLEIVPRQFFVPDIIERREPLKPPAHRAGWVGCNIRIDLIPTAARIAAVLDGMVKPSTDVRASWSRLTFVRHETPARERTWLIVIMRIVEEFGSREFDLAEVYRREPELARLFSDNRHIRAKIRQQLQCLRDAGLLVFFGNGRYRRT